MKIKLHSIFVDDQEKALKFYTEKLHFVKKQDIPAGDFRWLTLISPEDPQGPELVLEPNDNPAAQAFTKSLLEDDIPFTAFQVQDVHQEYERLKALGVWFIQEPLQSGPITLAIFNDTCGNLIQIYQV